MLIISDSEIKKCMLDLNIAANKIVTNETEMIQIVKKIGDGIGFVIILAELNWEGKYLQRFFGFELACYLRIKYKMCCPIIIVSSFPKEKFEKLSKVNPEKYNIIYAPGTYFMRIKDLYDLIEKDKSLTGYNESLRWISPALLEDMLEMLLQPKGFLIDKITHDIQYNLSKHDIEKAIDNISIYLTKNQIINLKCGEKIDEIKKAKNENEFNVAKNGLIDIIEVNIVDLPEKKENVKNKIKPPGHILIVEDDAKQKKQLKDHLSPYFNLILTQDAHEAIKILDEDITHEIKAVIADWRLLKYVNGVKTDYWQDIQGYSVLEKAAQTHFVALISLTAEYDKNVHQIRNILNLNIQLFKKEHIFVAEGYAQWYMFIDIIRDKCNEVDRLIASLPTGIYWEKYKKEYFWTRSSLDWNIYEKSVSDEADKLWQYYKEGLYLESRYNITKGLNDGILSLNSLKNILVGRRLFFALYYEFERIRNMESMVDKSAEQKIYDNGVDKSSSVYDAYSVLRNDRWGDIAERSEDGKAFQNYNQRKNNFTKELAIKTQELPFSSKKSLRILPEEKTWLVKKGVKIKINKYIDEDY